ISQSGDINISTVLPSDILIQSTAGTFQALNGNINVRDAQYNGGNNITISGGNFLSNQLNLYSGTGNINVVAGQVTGQVNSFAQTEHIFTDSQVLRLGNTNI